MADKKHDPQKVILMNVRLSFEALFEPDKRKADDGSTTEKWKSNFLLDKDAFKSGEIKAKYMGKIMPAKDALKLASNAAKEKKWGDETKWPKLKPDRVFLRDGDLEDWEGYPGNYYVSANANLNERPAVVTNRKDGNGNWIDAEPGGRAVPYSGCFVNATITTWAQDNEHGKRVNARVKAVQFYRDGEAFGAAPTDPNDDFDDDMVGEEGDLGYDDDADNGGGDDDDGLV